MKILIVKILSIIPFLILVFFFPQAQSITGSWQGSLTLGTQKLKIVFHIKPDSGHAYLSSFDSPDQAAFGIPCSETRIKEDSLEIQIKVINGGYRGKWDRKNSITGYYFQNGRNFPADLSRAPDTVAVLVRPQTPKPPFAYNSEDLEYEGSASGIHYSGTLTYPKSGGPFPAAILITGSGQQDRDEAIFGHKPFAVIADYLTKHGYAVLRVDDRGIGKSTGDISKATSRDFAKDVERSLQELQKRKDIDRKRIGLIGHSEGGLIASMVASENKSVDFIIMLAGPGLKGSALLEWQNEAAARSQGASAEMAESYKKLSASVIQAALSSRDTSVQMQEAWKSFLSWKEGIDPGAVSAMGLNNETNSKNFLRAQLERLDNPWMIYFLQTDPADYISKLHCKVLALNGAKDIQVVPDQNLAGIDSALKKSAVKIYATEKIPGLNHLFQHCKTCTIAEYAQLEESFAPEVLQIMGDWLDKNVK
ncbi:MAG: alpha/beta hydrolase family protein [Chitinophagales bacterium]